METSIQPVVGGPNYVNYKDTPDINIRNTNNTNTHGEFWSNFSKLTKKYKTGSKTASIESPYSLEKPR